MYGQNPLLFDIGADDKADEAMEETDAVMEVTREKEERKKVRKVRRNKRNECGSKERRLNKISRKNKGNGIRN
jgi:hypothetical protein